MAGAKFNRWDASSNTPLGVACEKGAVRCVELHAYAAGGGLLDAGHKDNGSKLTLIVQLSDASAFDGGHFVTYTEGEAVLHALAAGDGLLINSEKVRACVRHAACVRQPHACVHAQMNACERST